MSYVSDLQPTSSGALVPSLAFGQRLFGRGQYMVYAAAGTYTFTVPSGVRKLRVRCIGAGGSGGVVTDSNVRSTTKYGATGGAGGGYAEKTFAVTPGSTYTVTVGAGGAAVTRSTTGYSNGNAGGTTSFGAMCSATGGGAGTANTVSGTLPASNSGGTGSGGDINLTGGTGGQITNFGSGAAFGGATGGGSSATWLGNGFSGGVITLTGTSDGNNMATGGAGVGGVGGPLVLTNAVMPCSTGGGGAMGPGTISTQGYSIYGDTSLTLASGAVLRYLGDSIHSAGSNGSVAASTPTETGSGGGTGGWVYNSGFMGTTPWYAGAFAGGGGSVCGFNGGAVIGGSAKFGGGGGGAVLAAVTAATTTSGAGGDGMVIVEW